MRLSEAIQQLVGPERRGRECARGKGESAKGKIRAARSTLTFGAFVMKPKLTLAVWFLLVATVPCAEQTRHSNDARATNFKTRCGWFSNPTPANAWLWDREGEWIIGVQGGFQADGEWPDFKPRQWVRQNGDHGYGCACLRVRVDTKTRDILQIQSSRAVALSQCRRDPALKKWGRL